MRQMTQSMAKAVGRLLAKVFEAKLQGNGRPFVIAHFITHRCMCDCKSCLWKHNDWPDVPTEDLKRFYREARDAGFVATAFSGGEPFLRKDLGELVRYIKQELGMSIVCFTTGWLLERRMDEVLPHLDMLLLSVDSARPERHDAIRGLPGLFDRLISGVRLAKARYPNLSVQFNTCVQKGIADEIDDLIRIARSLDVPISFDVITEYRNGEEGSRFTETDVGLSPEALAQVCQHLIRRKHAGAPILNTERYFEYFRAGRPGYHCHFPKLCMCVDGRGYVENCLDLDHPLANIREQSVAEILALPAFKALRPAAERCCSCSSPTMVDLSHLWEAPQLAFQRSGFELG